MEKTGHEKMNVRAVVVLSGGQDSVTCLGVAIRDCASVRAIHFSYGQRHTVETEQAWIICDRLRIPLKVVQIPSFTGLVTSALIGDGDVNAPHPNNAALPASFVPGRNAVFLTLAHAYATEIRALRVYAGVCQTDYSGYPDCREVFIQQLNTALNAGYETNISFQTPLMHLTKAESFALAKDTNVLDTVLELSHTCYNGDRNTANIWGKGCGKCAACQLRAKGWKEYSNAVS
jgi:7-cyano-7-deazaguanine synthase